MYGTATSVQELPNGLTENHADCRWQVGERVAGENSQKTHHPGASSAGRARTYVLIVFVLLALVAVGLIKAGLSQNRQSQGAGSGSPQRGQAYSRSNRSAPVLTYEVVKTYPHDRNAFCQGLDFDGKTVFESTGHYGESTIRRVNLKTGKVEKWLRLDRRLFGEGLTLFEDKVLQLTWKRGLGYIYDAKTLKLLGTFRYEGEGWGLTHDDKHLIISDGTDRLRFLDPDSFAVVRTIKVKEGNRPVRELNELEFVKGRIFANVWHSDRIAMIDPDTGQVVGWIDLSGLLNSPVGPEAVLNGIAYEDGRLLVTGKNWPQLFEIQLRRQ